jgi:hypothetical protein
MSKWNSRHVIIGSLVLLGMFIIKLQGEVVVEELSLWYDSIKWLVGIVVFGHAANKFVDSKNV